MPNAKVETLTLESFEPYGYFSTMIEPKTEKIGAPPVEFYRDMLQLDLGLATKASFSVCRAEKRPEVVDVSEYHSSCGEAFLPLDNDILIHVAPATPGEPIPYDKIRIFSVPQGTLVVIKPGVWHHAPFVTKGECANVLIVLPERAYANDCWKFSLEKNHQVNIER
jgi:ureidoglycolate lyase